MPSTDSGKNLTAIRRGLLALLVLGLAGTGIELLLMGHTDGVDQWIPLILIGLSLVTLAWYVLAPGPASRLVFKGLMLLSIASGAAGSLLHYKGNVEFEVESMPGLGGWALFKQSMTGATPALAPGTMILLGALGLLFTLCEGARPSLSPSSEEP
jgi:hypothetical protein